jgi:hypothetical protein
VVAVATPILRHRLILNFAAQSEGITIDEVIRQLVKTAAKSVSGEPMAVKAGGIVGAPRSAKAADLD